MDDSRTRYGQVFAIHEFRYVFAAHTLSMLGVVLAQIALSVLVYERTSSAALSSLTFALGFVPYALGGGVFSSLADRFPPRRTLVLCDLASAAVVGVMALPRAPIPLLLGLLLVQGTIAPIFAGTRAATLPDILPGDLYILGRSLIRLVAQGTQVVGFAVGGLLLVAVSPQVLLVVTAVGFLASAAFLRLGTLERPAREAADSAGLGAVVRDSVGAVRTVLGRPHLRTLLLLSWLPPALAVAPEALAVPYAAQIGHPGVGAGLLLAAGPVGYVVGEVVVARFVRPSLRIRLVIPLTLCAFVPLLVFLGQPQLVLAFVLLALAGLGHASSLGIDQLLLTAIPEDIRGRAFTVATAGLMLTQGVGFAVAGVLGQFIGETTAIFVAGVTGIAVVVILGRLLLREQRLAG